MYGKVFRQLWHGSLYGRSDEQLVFVFLLGHKARDGSVEERRETIAGCTGLSPERVDAAIMALEQPDPESASPAEEGRRIVPLHENRAWGWRIVNAKPYSEMRDDEERRNQNKEAQSRRRQRLSASVSQGQPQSSHTDTDTDTDTEKKQPLLKSAPQPTASRSASRRSAGSEPPGFAEFYDAFPRHVGRAAAARAYGKAMKSHELAADILVAGAKRYAAERAGQDAGYTAHPATWLNAGRWLDEAPQVNGSGDPEQDALNARTARIRKLVEEKERARQTRQP